MALDHFGYAGQVFWPGNEGLLYRPSMLQAMLPSEVSHCVGDRFICTNALQVQPQEGKRFTQKRFDNHLAREYRVPLPGDLGPVSTAYPFILNS